MTKDNEDSEKYFQSSLQLALKNNISWKLLGSILDEMTPNLSKSKQVIKFLLEELEKMHLKLQENMAQIEVNDAIIEKTLDETIDSQEKASFNSIEHQKAEMGVEGDINQIENTKQMPNDDTEIYDDFPDILKAQADDKKENEEIENTEPFDLKQFYTFVASSEDKDDKTQNDILNRKLIEYQTKAKDQISISKKENPREKESFTTKGSLKIHEGIHSKEKHYECKTCKKRFVRSDHLKTHERIHSGEKPFKCKQCKKCFTQQSTL